MQTIHLAGCIVYDDRGRLLLLHRNTPKRRQWEIPGGKLEAGEVPETAAKRELKEELGVKVKITKELGSQQFTEDGLTMHYTWFEANIVSGKFRILEPQTFDEFRYFSMSELKNIWLQLSPNTQNFLQFNDPALID